MHKVGADHTTVLVNPIDVHKRAEHQMAAFAERGWPAGRIPTTREIVLSMIERSAWRYVTDVQAKLEAGEWTEYASSVRERDRTYPLSEFYDDHEHDCGSEPDESNEIVDDEMQVGREIDDDGADDGECSW